MIGLGLLSYLGVQIYRAVQRGKRGGLIFWTAATTFFLAGVIFLTSHLLPCFNLFHQAFCRGSENRPWIALTFDDGPNEPYTSQILKILEDNHVPATFFMVGENLTRHPELIKKIYSGGHELGNHTYSHTPLIFLTSGEIKEELNKWEQVASPNPTAPKLFRAPRGWKSPFLNPLLKEKGYQLIGWTRGVWDTDQPGSEVLFQRLTKGIGPGEIILLHDGMENESGVDRSDLVEVLPKVIQHYRGLGFRFVTISQLLGSSSS